MSDEKSENFIRLFTKLGLECAKSINKNETSQDKKEQHAGVRRLRQVAFDIMLSNHGCRRELDPEDWSAEILFTDLAYQFMFEDKEELGQKMLDELSVLKEGPFRVLSEILHFLQCLKDSGSTKRDVLLQHPYSISGEDYFLRNNNPFNLLPLHHLGSSKPPNTDGGFISGTKEETILFIDQFLEKEKKNLVPTRTRLSLDDFIDTPLKNIPSKFKSRVPKTTPSKIVPDNNLLKSMKSSNLLDTKLELLCALVLLEESSNPESETSFIEYYKKSLAEEKDIFSRGNRKTMPAAETRDLLLAVYEESAVIQKLIEPSCKISKPIRIDVVDFLKQTKYLLWGLDSCIFFYDNGEKRFVMKDGVYISGIMPHCLLEISKNFLKSGTYLKEITCLIESGPIDSTESGFLYSVFWQSVERYLMKHREAVARITVDGSLMSFIAAATPMVDSITAVHAICFPSGGAAPAPLPTGGLLLTHLYQSCCSAHQPHVQNAIFSILFDCCVAYVKKFVEPWVFQGYVEASWSSEVFVRINNELADRRDRACYFGPSMEEDNVPCFFRQLAASIFSCGKTVWLLKLVDPENKFIYFVESLRIPKLEICTTDMEFNELTNSMAEYEKNVTELCGEKVSFIALKEIVCEHEEQRIINMQITKRKIQEVLEKKKCAQIQIHREKIAKKENLLKEQLNAIAEKKLRDRMQKELSRSERCKDNTTYEEGTMDKHHAAFKSEITKNYKRLSEMADQMKKEANWQAQRLSLHEPRMNFLKDIDNEKIVLDQEGNVINATLEERVISPDVNDINENRRVVQYQLNCNFVTSDGIENLQTEANGNEEYTKEVVIIEPNGNEEIQSKKPASEAIVYSNLVAQLEAKRNKMKILGSEYGMSQNVSEMRSPSRSESNSAALQNKLKVLGSDLGHSDNNECAKSTQHAREMSDAQKHENEVMGAGYCPTSKEPRGGPSSPKPVTEAMKNKTKILGLEYNIISASNEVNPPRCSSTLTEAMKNKTNMMSTDGDRAALVPAEILSTGPMTDRQKNKLKSMGTEIDIAIPCAEARAISSNVLHSAAVLHSSDNDLPIEHLSSQVKENAKRAIFSFKDINEFGCGMLESIISNAEYATEEKFDSIDRDLSMFARNLKRSINMALRVQERLANAALLKHFIQEENIMTHLNCLRNHFLHNDGEFSRNLTHGLFQALLGCTEPQQFFDKSLLSGILNDALVDTNHQSQNLSFQIVAMPAKLCLEAHDVLAPFQLSYTVKWPLNIILTEASLVRYRQVFHILVNLKRVHWTLNENFLLLKTQTKDNSLDGKRLMNSPEYTKLAVYRHAMTLFIMTIEEHISEYGTQEAWHTFLKHLDTVDDLEELYQKHVAFVKDVCRRCFLVKATHDLLSYINELIELGLRFHFILKSTSWRLIDEHHYSHPKFNCLKKIFLNFCKTTRSFNNTLRKKTQHADMKIHIPLLDLFNLKLKVFEET